MRLRDERSFRLHGAKLAATFTSAAIFNHRTVANHTLNSLTVNTGSTQRELDSFRIYALMASRTGKRLTGARWTSALAPFARVARAKIA